MHTCRTCHLTLPLVRFRPNKKYTLHPTVSPDCYRCRFALQRAAEHRKHQARGASGYYRSEAYKAWQRAYMAGWRKRYPDAPYARVTENDKRRVAQWKKDNPEKVVRYSRTNRLRKYGMTHEDFDALVATQNSQCAICHRTFPPAQLHIDHCHASGTVRALLCKNCNSLLAFAEDNPSTLASAFAYLHTHTKTGVC